MTTYSTLHAGRGTHPCTHDDQQIQKMAGPFVRLRVSAPLYFLASCVLCLRTCFGTGGRQFVYRADHGRNRRRSRFKSNVFNANECDEIIVENAGYAPTNGVYVRSEAPLRTKRRCEKEERCEGSEYPGWWEEERRAQNG